MIGVDAGVHHVDDASGTAIAAVEVAVEARIDVADAVEVPQQVLGAAVAAIAEAGGGVLRVERDFDLIATGRDDVRWRGERDRRKREQKNDRESGE